MLQYDHEGQEEEVKETEQAAQSESTEEITPKEEALLRLLAEGDSYKEISSKHNIKITTIKWYIYNIYRKLQAKNRTDAVNKYFGKSQYP